METGAHESESWYKFLAWLEVNKKQVVYGIGGAILLGVVIWAFLYQREQKVVEAGEALSRAFVPQATGAATPTEAPNAYLKVASQYPSSSAGAAAQLLAATALFTDGKFSEAQAQFEKFTREHRGNPLLSEAELGIAACLDAQGKANEATAAYKRIVDLRKSENVVSQAKFALARLYVAQSKPELALPLYEDIAKSEPYTSVGSEAGMRAEELKQKYPQLVPPPPAPATSTTQVLTFSNTTPIAPTPTTTPSSVTPSTNK